MLGSTAIEAAGITSRLPDDLSTSELVTALVGGLALLAAFVSFLVRPGLTMVPFLVFVFTVIYGWVAHQARTARSLTFLTTVSSVVILVLITTYLFLQSIPVFRLMGIELLIGMDKPVRVFGVTLFPGLPGGQFWASGRNIFSLVPMIWGTFVTTILAMLLAGPLGVAGALFISEIAPSWARELVKPGIEILAGIPSIVYGYLGYVVLNPYMMEVFGLSNFGSLFVVGFVIGIMALPTVVSVAEDAISTIPDAVKGGSVAMGATEWQTMKSITLPAAFSGVSAAVLLGVGRAVGETMAATVILCHTQTLPEPLYDVFACTETLTSLIASQYGNAHGMQMNALFAAGVVLFVTVMGLSLASQAIEAHMKRKLRGEE